MKLETLKELWQAKNPGGNVWYTDGNGKLSQSPIGKSKKFAVTFKADGKLYTYTMPSVLSLAERYELIPSDVNVDYWQESRRAIAAVDNSEVFITSCGLYDTIRTILADGKYTVRLDWKAAEPDEYDREQWAFSGYKLYNSWEEREADK